MKKNIKRDNENQDFCLGRAATEEGTIYYFFNYKKIDIMQFVELELHAQFKAMKRQYRLFKLYDTDSIGYTVLGLN
jgi:hypothetical protein